VAASSIAHVICWKFLIDLSVLLERFCATHLVIRPNGCVAADAALGFCSLPRSRRPDERQQGCINLLFDANDKPLQIDVLACPATTPPRQELLARRL